MEFAKLEPDLHFLQKNGIVPSLTVAEQNHDNIGRKKLEKVFITYVFVLDPAFQNKCDTVLSYCDACS